MIKALALALLIGVLILSIGCNVVGPRAVKHGGISYNRALQYTSDQQLLLNIVRLRYRDNPSFLEISSISTSFTLSGNVGTDLTYGNIAGTAEGLIIVEPTVGVTYDEKPTITYMPLKGESFVKQLLTPISGETFLLLYYSGWRIERLFRCMVYRMNDVLNAPRASSPTPDDIPVYEKFVEACGLVQSLRKRYQIFLKVEKKGDKHVFSLNFSEKAARGPEVARIREILGLNPDRLSYPLIQDMTAPHNPDAIIIGTRSVMGMLYYLSTGIEVSERDLAKGIVTLTPDENGTAFDWTRVTDGIFRVKSGDDKPAAVSIQYRGRRFYIDDSDLDSKATFMMVTQVLALQSGDIKMIAPALTISVGG